MNRLAKQLIIGGIFLAIVGVPAWFLYRTLVPAATCSDGIQNGAEEGVDCGAAVCGVLCPPPVQALNVQKPQIFITGTSSFDVLVRIDNPNIAYGVSRVDYTLTVTDVAGKSIGTRRGFTYVDPIQPRYLVFPFTSISEKPSGAELQFVSADVQWGVLAVDAAANAQFVVRGDVITTSTERVQYDGVVVNRSTFDFDTVDVTVLLRNANGDIVGANSTVLRTLAAGEQRGFTVEWPFLVSNAVRAEAIVTTNLFSNSNFIKSYGSQERFQEH